MSLKIIFPNIFRNDLIYIFELKIIFGFLVGASIFFKCLASRIFENFEKYLSFFYLSVYFLEVDTGVILIQIQIGNCCTFLVKHVSLCPKISFSIYKMVLALHCNVRLERFFF